MADSASLKIQRAEEHIAEIREVIAENLPFWFSIETDTATGQRTLFIEENKAIVNQIALACGDAVHNLRSALDHAYWEIVSPNGQGLSEQQRRKIQFPFTSKASELRKTIRKAHACLAGTGFPAAIFAMQPHGETGGDELLTFINRMDILDKHKLLIPAVNTARIKGKDLKAQVPDLPFERVGELSFLIDKGAKFSWTHSKGINDLGTIIPPTLTRYKRKLDIPIEISFQIPETESLAPLVTILEASADACRETIARMRDGAASY